MRIDEWLRSKKYPVSVKFWPSPLGLRIRMEDEKTGMIHDGLLGYELLEKSRLDVIELMLDDMYDNIMDNLGREDV